MPQWSPATPRPSPSPERAAGADKMSIARICAKQLQRYFDNTSVHGVKYLTERRRPLLERLLWLLFLVLALGVSSLLIWQSWQTRASSPVVLAMDKKQVAVWEVPFPATTICPTERLKHMEPEDPRARDIMCARLLVCTKQENVSCSDSAAALQIIEENSPNINDILLSSGGKLWHMLGIKGDIQTKRILTSEGLCHSFNMIPGPSLFVNGTFHADRYLQYDASLSWDAHEGYRTLSHGGSYPRRALGPGEDAGLLLVLKNARGAKPAPACHFARGFQIQVHNPAEFPNENKKITVPFNSMVSVTVTAEQVISDDLHSYSPDERHCYYPGERPLQFFQVYTQKNCELECLANYTLRCCGCVDFYMPRHENTSVCLYNGTDKTCSLRAKEQMQLDASELEYQSGNDSCPSMSPCKCLPSCHYLMYRSQVSHTPMDRGDMNKILEDDYGIRDVDELNITIIQIFYTSSHFIPFRRIEIYGTVEFLANCGGVLGLCLGMSVLSMLELAYWLLVRPWWCWRPRRRAGAAAAEEDVRLTRVTSR